MQRYRLRGWGGRLRDGARHHDQPDVPATRKIAQRALAQVKDSTYS